jgi:hypothetical protein
MVHSYVRDWKRYGATYKSMLDAAEDVLANVSNSYRVRHFFEGGTVPPVLQPVITREHSDIPEVTVSWRSDDAINRSVQVAVVHNKRAKDGEQFLYQLTISAWHDDLNRNQRRWWQEQIGAPIGLEGIRESIQNAVEAARRLGILSLKHTDPLPPLPPGLSEEQRNHLIGELSQSGHNAGGPG